MDIKDIKVGCLYRVDGEVCIYCGIVPIGNGTAHAFTYDYGTLYLNTTALKNKLNTTDFEVV